jgi:hypothetical protein
MEAMHTVLAAAGEISPYELHAIDIRSHER